MRNLNPVKIIYLITLALTILSCSKEPDLIGLDLIPSGDLIDHDIIDTSTVIAYTVREDSLRTDEVMSYNLLGSINDQRFGRTTASIYTNYRLPVTKIKFGTNPVLDSAVLTIVYKGIYGDSLYQHDIQVFELSDTLDFDTTYFSTSTRPRSPVLIGQATFIPNLKAADSVNNAYVAPHMRITLTPEFARRIMSSDSATLSSNTKFGKAFKGLYITSTNANTPGTGAIMYVDLQANDSKLRLYYHNSADTTHVDFRINANSSRFNHYDHFGYQGANPLLLQQLAGDTTSGNQKLFIEGMGGTKLKVRLPYISDLLKDKKIAINEALLVMESDEPSPIFKTPSLIVVRKLTSEGKYETLPDENLATNFIGGMPDKNNTYTFRITRYVQQRLLNPDAPDYGLMLLVSGSSLSSNRAVFKGPGAPAGKMKLVVYYTLLK